MHQSAIPTNASLARVLTHAIETADKPKRERSAKLKQNDDDMRACGANWRAEKETLSTKGTTWRSFLKDCRAAKKAGRERA
jgi:hypothetical protein